MILTIVLLLGLFTAPAAAAASSSPRENASMVCLIGEASVSLLKEQGRYRSADAATEAAQAYAAKRCKGGLNLLSEGGSDYVYHSIKAIAKTLYGDDD